MKIKYPLANSSWDNSELNAMKKVIDSGRFSMGKSVKSFEKAFSKYLDSKFVGVTIRPATLCGYAPRCRLDLSVNILTNHAVNNSKITVLGGGEQKRPNLDVRDMCRAYKTVLDASEDKINNEVFNVSYDNKKIIELAKMVKTKQTC